MKRYICKCNPKTGYWEEVRVEEAEPVCGEAYCDACGDCLACWPDDFCGETKDGKHVWIVYEEDADADE